MVRSKFDVQNALYKFPYHYLSAIEQGSAVRLHRQLPWGLEYMTYISFIAELIKTHRPESLLDIGCGDGRFIYMIKRLVPIIRGIDWSEKAIAFARAFNPEVDFICDDISKISDKYGIVTLIEVLEHIPDNNIVSFIRNVSKLVQDNGFLIISVPTINVSLNKKHYRHYSFDLLQSFVKDEFEIEKHWWLYRRCFAERIVRRVLCNSLFTLNYSPARALIWRIHKRSSYMADELTGSHLVCIAKPK